MLMDFLKNYLSEVILLIVGITTCLICYNKIGKNFEEILKNFKKQPKKIIFTIVYMLLVFVPTCINLSYKIGANVNIFIYTDITVNDMIGFYGDVLSFIGTVSLGALALWQNNHLTKQNQKYSEEIKAQEEEKNKLIKTELIKPKFLIAKGPNSSSEKFDIKIINRKSYDINNFKFHNNIDESIELKENIPTNIKGSESSILTMYIEKKVKALNNKSYAFLVSCEDQEQNEYYYKYIFNFNAPYWTIEENEEISKSEFEQIRKN